MAIQSLTICANSSVVMPVCVAMKSSMSPWSPPSSAAFTSPLSSEANGSLVFPLGMLRRERLHAVGHEVKLDRHRLLAPERAVVVEGGDAFGDRHEVRRAGFRHLLDESR